MSIKDIIAKAKESQDTKEAINPDTTLASLQDTKEASNPDTTLASLQDTKEASNPDTTLASLQDTKKNKTKKDLARKVMNLDVPAAVKNYWMGQIKGEGASFKEIVVSTLIKKYGLPENWSKDEI